MSLKHSCFVLLALLILISSLGLVCASENVSDSTSDIYGVSQDQVSFYDDSDLTNENSPVSTYQEKNFTNNKNSNDLLGISNNDEILRGNVITFDGTYFNDLRIAIDKASDNDIIDLEGKTIITVVNGNPKIQTDKQLTFINGVLDAQYAGPISTANRNFITNCHFENITFKNYNAACMYPNFFRNCTLNHVSFENFTLAVAGFVFRNSNLYDVNFTNCHSLEKENPDDYEYAAMAVTYNSVIDNCNFINCTTNRHSGAICVAGENGNRVDILNSNFINCSAGIGGAIYVHGNRAINENYHSNIINCTFIGNTATERGGAIGSSQNYLIVENCTFENNTAKQGAAYMLAGIDHGLDGIREGHYNTMINCYFKNNTGTEEGGAVHITGNNNRAINCTFDSNFATNGNGSAVYIHGENASIINSEFYNHECSRGTVYIIGDNSIIDNSTFENNTASRGGAGIYVEGDNTLVNNSVFNSNNATIHGGAIHSHGDNIKILNSNFTSNSAIASTEDLQQGLGGAVYITGDNSAISNSNFINNVARNGSAIYNRGNNLTIGEDTFFENQAWSYLLTNIANFKRIYYDPEKNVTINVTFKGGDNIINAIHNDGTPSEIFFYNVTYEFSLDKNKNTGLDVINPVDGVENSDDGRLLYQDPREDLQNITIIVTHLESGKVVINHTGQTGIFGNISVSRKGLLPGNYSVNVTHFEDGLYKYITNMTFFEILPIADLAVEKNVSDKTPNFGDEIIWTIKVTNNGPSNVTDAYVIDKLPDGLIFKGSDGKYNSNSGIWDIGRLNVGESAVLKIRTVVNITNSTITNVATVNSSIYDPNKDNNVANNTTKSNPLCDLSVVKLVSKETSVIGETIIWTIIVTNKGPDTALNAYAIDNLPPELTYVSDDSKGKYDPTTGIWDIGNLKKDASAILNIQTKVNKDNTTITNNVFVNTTTPDSNKTNNNASNKTNVLDSNLDVQKITLTPLVNVGDQVTFQIVVRNSGLTTLHNVFVEESQYDGLIFDSSLYQSHWDYSKVKGKNRWTLNTELGVGQVVVLSVVFNTTKEGNFTNIVVAGSDETENKTAHNDTTVVKPSFTVEKVTLTPLVNVGEQVTFEIVVTNTGKLGLTDVFVEEFSYDGLIFD
uniref:hypothetical protein n=1 Tax=Methanobrevibacter sp. TaxID=66852 RepID=UPI00388F5F1E